MSKVIVITSGKYRHHFLYGGYEEAIREFYCPACGQALDFPLEWGNVVHSLPMSLHCTYCDNDIQLVSEIELPPHLIARFGILDAYSLTFDVTEAVKKIESGVPVDEVYEELVI